MTILDFEYSQTQLQTIANDIIECAKKMGAKDSQLEINENIATNVDVLNTHIDHFENSYERSISLTVYLNNKRGSIAVTNIKQQNIEDLVAKALQIATYTEEDPYQSLPDVKYLCQSIDRELELYNIPNDNEVTNQKLIEKAYNIEALGLKNPLITSSDGASVSLNKHNFVIANSSGLNLGYKTTRFSTSLSLIANTTDGMQTDYWYSASRDFGTLMLDTKLADITTQRVLRRLDKGVIQNGQYPVIFDNDIAKSIIGNFLGAISGGSLFRRLSFLNDSINTQIFPDWMNISEDPFIKKGLGSCYFDNEGVIVKPREIVKNGTVCGYVLSNYTAKKMNMELTGNSGGTHNVVVKNNFTGGVMALAQQMNNGVIIIDTIGHGLNMVTGDYSVGASGILVQNGKIGQFVDNITISGNLKQIFKDIVYITEDDTDNSSMHCGAMLVKSMNVSSA